MLNEMNSRSGAEVLVEHLVARGVRRIYGVPGGDCSLDIIDAADRAGITFVLTATENSAAMMACVEAELTGTLGVLLTTRGPGIGNAVNGIAYALLDRAPLVLLGDGYENNLSFVSHQRFDQAAVLKPVLKGVLRLDDESALPGIGALLDLAQSGTRGPVYIELTGASMRGSVPAGVIAARNTPVPVARAGESSLDAARQIIAASRKPVMIIGMQARKVPAAHALRQLAKKLNCPVYQTYKAKGVLAEQDPNLAGYYIGGAAEEEAIRSSDLIIMCGADPIEFPPQAWKYDTPVIELTEALYDRNYYKARLAVLGELTETVTALAAHVERKSWSEAQLAALKTHMVHSAQANTGGPITPQSLVQKSCAHMPAGTRVTIDAGIHMLSVVAFYQAHEPNDALISRGLATMGFALPAAIGMAMADPSRHVIAFTGDGGLMMCAAELATAAQLGCRLTVVVFNDSAITMIDVKQRRRKLPTLGMAYFESNFAQVGAGFGCAGFRAATLQELDEALKKAFAHDGPSVVDAVLDPSSYHEQLRSMRG